MRISDWSSDVCSSDLYEHLVRVDRMPWCMQTAVRGAAERLIPILMTALVTAFALLPLALTSGAAGNEIEGPMAIVILGGRSEEHTSELQSLMRISYAVFCLKKKRIKQDQEKKQN